MKHPERTFISKKILWDTKEFNFSSWIWTHTVSVTQGCAAKWIQGYNICSKFSEFQVEKEKSHTHTHTHTGTYTDQSADILFLNQWSNFYIASTELQRSKGETTLNSRTAGCTPSLPTMRMRGFLSRMLMHTQRVDTLNECEIVGTVRIFIKSKQISSLWHYGYYTHS
jgi:hypothetical protein